jgi:hypothetical protein
MRLSMARLVRPARLAWIAGSACLAASGCPARRDASDVTPMVHVSPGAASRWGAALGREPGRPTGAPARAARVHVMLPGEALGGPNAIGRPGDLVLENDQVVFVVDQLGSSTGFAESGGNVVDAADARTRLDELGQIFTFFGTFPRQAVYDRLSSSSSGATADGAAWIEARGRELRQPSLVVTTRYTLRPPDRALLIETTLENTDASPAELPALGDAIQWGGAEKVAPGRPRGFKGASTGPYVGGVGRFTSYALTSTEGAVAAQSGSSWTDTAQRERVTIAPHGSTRYARIFLVGERADTSSLVGELAQAAGASVGDLRVVLPEGTALPTGAVVTLRAAGSQEALTLAPPFVATLPVGAYSVGMAGDHATAGATAAPTDVDGGATPKTVEVGSGAETRVDLSVPPAATLEVHCVGVGVGGADAERAPVPCKVTFAGSGPTPTPDFGPGHAAGPARNQATSGDGTTRVALASGAYTVTASRGPEYALASVQVALAPGAARSVDLTLVRVVDTRGYIACDFHQHTMASADAPVTEHDRVIGNAAEGVEAAIASEHNAVVDLEPIVRELHLDRDLVEIAGDELTSDADRRPWGHANAFPLPFDPSRPNGGAPPLRGPPQGPDGARADLTPASIFAWIRANVPGDHVIQVNHPRSGNNGYFDLLQFDRTRGAGASPAYDGAFDAIEVWNGRNLEARSRVVDDWRALLRTGHAVTPTANTDTHGIVGQEAGYPRTMVRVADDAHLDTWDAARTADLVRGVKGLRDVVLTNGPMLRVTANGAPVGGVARGRVVTVRAHVECAAWVDVDAVRVVRASGADTSSDDDPAWKPVTLAPLPSGARAADVTFVVHADADDALFVVATGHRPLAPVLGGDERDIRPWAMTGAIWVDADGDGRALGR